MNIYVGCKNVHGIMNKFFNKEPSYTSIYTNETSLGGRRYSDGLIAPAEVADSQQRVMWATIKCRL